MAKLALLGGKPVVGKKFKWTEWPLFSRLDEDNLFRVLQGRRWCRLYPNSWAEKFEKKWAKFCNSKYCILTSNGTVSLELALKTLKVKPGDEVIVPAVTFIASVSAITEVGGVPIFADIDPETAQIDPSSVEEKITKRTRGILGVHYAGYPFDLDKILKICKRYNLFLLEDCAHAHGSEWKDKKVGSFGEFGSFSFQETKSLTSGEGGAVITNRKDFYEEALLINNIGRVLGKPGYLHFTLSSNYRLSEFQAALLLSQLRRLPRQSQLKEENGEFLKKELKNLGLLPLKPDKRITRRGYYFIVFRYKKENFSEIPRDTFMEALQAEGVPAGKAYGVPLYKNPCFEKEALSEVYPREILKNLPNYSQLWLPGSEKFCEEQVVFLHWILLGRKERLQKIVDAVEKIKKNIGELKKICSQKG